MGEQHRDLLKTTCGELAQAVGDDRDLSNSQKLRWVAITKLLYSGLSDLDRLADAAEALDDTLTIGLVGPGGDSVGDTLVKVAELLDADGAIWNALLTRLEGIATSIDILATEVSKAARAVAE